MTSDEANGYAARYRNTWRGGPTVDVLRDEFIEMDPGTLGTTLVRLARETDNPPSVAAIWRLYQTLATPAMQPVDPTRCVDCDSDGYIPGDPIWETVNGQPHEYTTLARCHCNGGQRPTATPAPPAPTLEEF